MNVAEAVGAALTRLGVRTVFGVVGSGNFHVTNALVAGGARFVAARHEAGAATMADAFSRSGGGVGVLSVHQGPGLTNALTGITEAAKSRTPLLVLAAETAASAVRSNFRIDQSALATAVGAIPERVHSPASAMEDVTRAWRTAVMERRTVVLGLPLDVQAAPHPGPVEPPPVPLSPAPIPPPPAIGPATPHHGPTALPTTPPPVAPPPAAGSAVPHPGPSAAPSEPPSAGSVPPSSVVAGPAAGRGPVTVSSVPPPAAPVPPPAAVAGLADVLAGARRPVFLAGRGARGAGGPLRALASRVGALLATSAVARGLFRGDPFDLDVSGGFATPVAAELVRSADVLVGWGCSMNMWTLRHGSLVGEDTTVVQIDLDSEALGAHRPIDLGVIGDVSGTALAVEAELARRSHASAGARSPELAERLAREGRWRAVPYEDASDATTIDPRTLSIRLDDLLPVERTVAVDSGNFMAYPAMFLEVPEGGLVFTQAFQSIGLGLSTAIGAAVARPDRLTVAALGDGGALMGIAELETAVRLSLGLLIVIYDDEAYGAEVHHFGPDGHPLDTVRFPPTDIAAIGRGFGCQAITVRRVEDLEPVTTWLNGPRDRPLLVHAKVTSGPSWWLEEAFRGR
ncbi:thiamine pyrophosphate-binding protein [Actinomadura sp. DC4]|uniref:thiamine pyrophosphate-binding protein n=1 Tax=Actinomadura sp. DC4 TaxID=3055069 RepID=UPI0025AF53B6|nr:thiamine pyrophosphate-binding protein [Actinomadura sp. DC4]MDN3357982.1 thiamine pyrophosphate-binding protein [Actinomadura sp. DC4]